MKEILRKFNIIYIIVIVMFLLSSLFTVKVYIGDSNNLSDQIILASMGICLELAKIVMIPIVVKFKSNCKKFWTGISSIILLLLIAVSIYSNYQYTNSINENKNEKSKIETTEYKSLNGHINILNKSLNESLNEKKSLNIQLLSLNKSLNEVNSKIESNIQSKNDKVAGITNVYKIESYSKLYDDNIKSLNENKKSLNDQLESLNKSLNKIESDVKVTNKSLNKFKYQISKVKKFEYKNTSSFGNKNIRIILGILFEIVAISLFLIHNISIIEPSPKIVKQIRKEKIKEVKQIPQVIPNNIVNFNLDSKYLQYIKDNIKDDNSIPSDANVIKDTNFKKNFISKCKKQLLEDGVLIKKEGTNKIFLNNEDKVIIRRGL
jgi:hypothetical protein